MARSSADAVQGLGGRRDVEPGNESGYGGQVIRRGWRETVKRQSGMWMAGKQGTANGWRLLFLCHPERSVTEPKDLPTAGRQCTVSVDSRKVLRPRCTRLRMTEILRMRLLLKASFSRRKTYVMNMTTSPTSATADLPADFVVRSREKFARFIEAARVKRVRFCALPQRRRRVDHRRDSDPRVAPRRAESGNRRHGQGRQRVVRRNGGPCSRNGVRRR